MLKTKVVSWFKKPAVNINWIIVIAKNVGLNWISFKEADDAFIAYFNEMLLEFVIFLFCFTGYEYSQIMQWCEVNGNMTMSQGKIALRLILACLWDKRTEIAHWKVVQISIPSGDISKFGIT
jgi:hypothetical protein